MALDPVLYEAGLAWGTIVSPQFIDGQVWSYEQLENDLWRNVLENFIARTADAVAFRGIASEEELQRFPSFSDWLPGAIVQKLYCPVDEPSDARKPLEVRMCSEKVAVIELSPDVLNRIRRRSFDKWVRRDVMFFRGGKELLRVTPPWLIRFFELSPKLLSLLYAADSRVKLLASGPHPLPISRGPHALDEA